MTRNTRFKSGVSGNPGAKWKPGQSGNPAGKSQQRTRFEDAFNEALITEGSPEEAAKLLWESARGKEPWAIQEVCRRFSPVTESLHMTHEVENDRFDSADLPSTKSSNLRPTLSGPRPSLAYAMPVRVSGGTFLRWSL